MPKVSPHWQRLSDAGGAVPVEVRWVPLPAQDAQARSAQLRRLLIVGAQRLAQAEVSPAIPAGHTQEGEQTDA